MASSTGDGQATLEGTYKSQFIQHFTFTWYTLTMSTAGIAHVLSQVPFQFGGLYAIGCMFMILNICFFIVISGMMFLRFYWHPKAFKGAFLHPTESLFIPALVLSIAQILITITDYGLQPGKAGEWLVKAMTVLYWMYVLVAMISSAGIYLLMWSTQTFTIAQMTPIWIFPAYPLLLVGPFAGTLSNAMMTEGIHSHHRLRIIVAGVISQGLGFLLSSMVYAAFLYRLMTHKLPTESTRPGMFVSVGPSGFTASSLIQMGAHFPTVVPANFMDNGVLAGQVSKIVAYWAGIWIYGLAIWFFLVSVGAHWSCIREERLTFAMTWYAFIFPNSSLVTSTFNVAKALGDVFAIEVVGCVLAGLLVAAWSFIIGMNIRAVATRQILWPLKGEDSAEHVFRADGQKRASAQDGVAGSSVRVGGQMGAEAVSGGSALRSGQGGVFRDEA